MVDGAGWGASMIDVLKTVSWVQTTPNAKMNTTNFGETEVTSFGLCPIVQY
jgi:hypothetical protein